MQKTSDRMYRVLLALLGLSLLPMAAQAQLTEQVHPVDAAHAKAEGLSAKRGFHATTFLSERPEGRAALEEYHARKAAGLLPAPGSAPKAGGATVGSQVAFSVYNFNTESYETIDFTLKIEAVRYNIWVETALLDGTVTDPQINSLHVALGTSTPAGSYNSGQGIIVNDEEVFGLPPDYDQDNKTDILLLDVRDDPSQGFVVLGFFDPRDLSSAGNARDILYLDTDPGLNNPETILATAAHEYQHLIMAAYDGNENTFVNEAQSEWAELMNGYYGRDMDFLSDLTEHGTAFFRYRDDVGGILDRERGQLYTLYIAEQYGTLIAGAVTRQAGNGQSGYGASGVLGSVSDFENTVVDFHVANLYNDTSLGSKYGYVNPFYDNVRTTADVVIDGRTESNVSDTQISLEGGAVHYADFSDVTDLVVSIDVNPSNATLIPSYRARTSVRALLERPGQALQEVDFTLDGSDLVLNGVFDRVRLVIVNRRAQDPPSPVVPVLYSATWQSQSSGQIVSVQFDDGDPSRQYFATNGSWIQLTTFTVPDADRATLDAVSLAPFFDNQFLGTTQSTSAPRDIELLVLDATSGTPNLANEIFSLVVDDPRPFSEVLTTSTLNHFEVDLSSYSAQLSNLPDEVYIGFGDAGADANYTVFGPAINTVDDVSFVRLPGETAFSRLWSVRNNDETCCNERVVPVRAHFLVADVVSVDPAVDVAEDITLLPNYPNPFASVTEIGFDLASPAPVRLTVFDLLGREVQVLADDVFGAGRHTVSVSGAGLSAGMYFYRLESTDVEVTRTMVRL